MKFGYVGINYKNAKLDVRDKISFTDVLKIEFIQNAMELGIDQCMVLSTCNRSEVFYFFKEEEQKALIRNLYIQTFQDSQIDAYLNCMEEEEAMQYLFRITAGLESLVIGEDQILGQVKDALDFSKTMGGSKKELNKIVRDAVTCAKKIKTDLKISEKPLSVSYIGILQVNEHCGIQGKNVLVIGSGKTASLALKYVYEYGAQKVMLCNRTKCHAESLCCEYENLEIIDYENRYQAMQMCDIVISATASPHTIIKSENYIAENPITMLDLAAPRDIDVSLQNYPQVTLINLDTLQHIAEENQKERERLVEISKEMITEAVQETKEWFLSSRMDTTIESLQQRCEEIVEDSYEYLNRKMDLSAREQKILKKVLHASLQRMIREPIQELKSIDSKEKQDEYKKVVKDLFQI